jgi:hypothetical protein
MLSRRFTPPRYEKTMHIVFDKNTGVVLATELRWNLVRDDTPLEPTVQPEVLKSVASHAEKQEDDLDVLVLREVPTTQQGIPNRIDVRSRSPIFEEALDTSNEGIINPSKIDSP